MNKKEKNQIIEKILQSCLFSEYLPKEFTTQKLTRKNLIGVKDNTKIAPIDFSMDKFNETGCRRFLSIPDINNYLSAVNALYDDVLEEIIKLNNQNEHSLSKILNSKNEIQEFGNGYRNYEVETQTTDVSTEKDDNFSNNLKIKIEKSKLCECILHLDISNFFSSIYTHNITTLTKGYEWANDKFNTDKNDNHYQKLANLDSKIAGLNLTRTHGLLIGPRLSFIIAESLLTIIDKDLENELKGIDFVRFVDDYDVFIKNKEDIKQVQDIFNKTLLKYGLQLNDQKTRIEEFPFYIYKNYEKLETQEELSEQYAVYGEIEKSRTQNGALLYFCQNVLSKNLDKKLSLSLSLSILKNIPKALESSCNNIIKIKELYDNKNELKELLIKVLKEFISKKYDLETIWVLYLILKLFPDLDIEQYDILKDLHEIALIVYMYESSSEIDNNLIKERAKVSGWLLNYELYFKNIITEDELRNNLKVEDVSCYTRLKNQNINFYIKQRT